jgi:hypothetical protein
MFKSKYLLSHRLLIFMEPPHGSWVGKNLLRVCKQSLEKFLPHPLIGRLAGPNTARNGRFFNSQPHFFLLPATLKSFPLYERPEGVEIAVRSASLLLSSSLLLVVVVMALLLLSLLLSGAVWMFFLLLLVLRLMALLLSPLLLMMLLSSLVVVVLMLEVVVTLLVSLLLFALLLLNEFAFVPDGFLVFGSADAFLSLSIVFLSFVLLSASVAISSFRTLC